MIGKFFVSFISVSGANIDLDFFRILFFSFHKKEKISFVPHKIKFNSN